MLSILKTIQINIPYNTKIFGHNINFNPSIIHIQNNMFLVSFYTFTRSENGYPKNITPQPSIYDDYHMYKGGPDSDTWWNSNWPGFRGTGFMIIQIIDRKYRIHQIFNMLGL